MGALGYDRLVTASMIILGAMIGVMGCHGQPVLDRCRGRRGGGVDREGIGLRIVMWVVLTAMATAWVVRYAAKVRWDPMRRWSGGGRPDEQDETTTDKMAEDVEDPQLSHTLTGTQKWVLVITVFAFGLMIFSVIPWSSIFGSTTGAADYYVTSTRTATPPYWFELNWWFRNWRCCSSSPRGWSASSRVCPRRRSCG